MMHEVGVEWHKDVECTLPLSVNRQYDRYNTQTDGYQPTFDILKMSDILYGAEFSRNERMEVYKVFDNPKLLAKRLYTMDKFEARQYVEEQAKILLKHHTFSMRHILKEPIKIVHRITMCGMLSLSLGTKVGVQSGLFGGSIINLGTARHEYLLAKVEKLEIAGGFLMTELAHGKCNLKIS